MRLAPSSGKWRSLNLRINLALSLASFALGVVVNRVPLPSASGAERELVSGALPTASSSMAPAAPAMGVGVHPALAEQVQPAEAPHGVAKTKVVDAEPSWSRLAGRAQSWTAAVRAD